MSPSPARQSLPKALASCWVEVTWEGPWSASMTTLRDAENNRECCGSASDRRAASRKWSNAKTCATHLLRSSSPSCFPYTPPSFPFLPRLSSSLANAVSASPNKWSASWALRDPSPRNGRAASSAAFSHGASIDAKSPSTCARRTWSHRTSSSGLNTKRFAATSSTTFLRASTKLSLRQTAAQRRRRSLFCAVANSAFGAVDLFDEAPTNNSSSHALREASSGTVVSRTASEARLAATARARSSNRRSTPRRTWPAGRGVAFFGGGGGGASSSSSDDDDDDSSEEGGGGAFVFVFFFFFFLSFLSPSSAKCVCPDGPSPALTKKEYNALLSSGMPSAADRLDRWPALA
mmetsp:Transcript_6829/g.21359  ORF Transcript_6829/g.21359 Transcript_6829/m.21359 type:complete len:348 (-) Transcript_6829:415-1458(-)